MFIKPQFVVLFAHTEAEIKARNVADAESIEVENLYSRVQSQLRTSRRSSQPPPTPPAQRQTSTVTVIPAQAPRPVAPPQVGQKKLEIKIAVRS